MFLLGIQSQFGGIGSVTLATGVAPNRMKVARYPTSHNQYSTSDKEAASKEKQSDV